MTITRDMAPAGELCTPDRTIAFPSTIQHWQLRDLLHCPEREHELYCTNRHYTLKCTPDEKRVLVQDLHFEPTSLAVRYGYIAAGGQTSQLDVRALGSGEIAYKGDCGGSVNNALHFARDASGQVRLFVANNDESIKIFGLPHGRLLASVDCPTSINYCALSPCARHLLAVGDNRGTYLYAARPSGYWQAKSWVEAGDAGMGCAWSPSGSLFAAVSQDGLCCVWDHRSQGVVVRYMTPLACRNVKFAPAPLDLMAFTEHRGRTHLVDMRMWGRHQVLHLGSGPGHDPEISGLAFSPSGQSLYVGLPEGIARFAIDAQSRFSFPAVEVC
ncbi:hypothetical protein ACKKBF_B34160 [Auxenochlorella protothecoides x Auxenochlorella symbiontica]